MRCSSLLAFLFAITMPVAVTAQAPEPGEPGRAGFWISFGLGGGSKWLSCDELCTEEFGQGTAGNLALGGTLNAHWLIGAEMVGWFPWSSWDEGYNDDTDGFGGILFTARHYPRAEANFFLTGGAGLGEIDVQQDLLEATGYVVRLGAGYDLRVGRTFAFTPSLTLTQTIGTEAQIAGETVAGDMNFGMAVLGVAVTWY